MERERERGEELERLEQLHWKLNTCHVYTCSANRAKHFIHSSFLYCPAGLAEEELTQHPLGKLIIMLAHNASGESERA